MNKTHTFSLIFMLMILLTQSFAVLAEEMDPVYEPIDAYLATPAPGHIYEIPVVVIRFLPTADGENLDTTKVPDFWEMGKISLADMKARIDTFDKRIKFMLEEGSRFRGYKDSTAPPSLGYRVVEYITVYEHTPPGPVTERTKDGTPLYSPDFHQIFDRFNIRHYVDNLGVKEIWVWMGGGNNDFPSYDPTLNKPENFRHWWESNMSSPLTGDISNSNRDNSDLPIYNSTYTVYGQNIWRTQAEAVHNHGHQLEAILSHVNWLKERNADFFWQKFVGQNENGDAVTGRVGSTHMPPNTTKHYDYTENLTPVKSDIEDWTPDNSGAKKLVDVDTYGDLPYAWPEADPIRIPQRIESQWYIYWMQNMPGHGNQIRYGQKHITNWWIFTADWDAAISSSVGLFEQTRRGIGFTEAHDESPGTGQTLPSLQSDEFAGTGQTLQSFWQVRNADKSLWQLKDGKLLVDAGLNQDLWNSDTTTRFYQPTDKTQFEIETSFMMNYVDACAVAGLVIYSPVIYSSVDEWVTLKLYGYNNEGASVQFQRRGQGLGPDTHLQVDKGRIPIQMRLKRDGNTYAAWYRLKAQNSWTFAGQATVDLRGPVEVGIYAGICESKASGSLKVTFDYFHPGFREIDPLPVSLSSFRPERDKTTGEVIIRWITESELNNAGFNILRSETKTGTFKRINLKGIIPGHGTTSERHVYQWKDTTAKPNVVYYYQIEDVSLDGTHTTLTMTHLRGNVTAAEKITTTWGDLKNRLH